MFGLSDHTKAVLLLWANDPKNWRIGSHAVVHLPTGIGVWTANQCYGVHIVYDIPEDDRLKAHSCKGREIRVGWLDRRALYRAIIKNQETLGQERLQWQVLYWVFSGVRNSVTDPVHERHDDA